ncbi:hypothetical protein ABFS82_11G124200 [Erythranthe guttata]
MKMGIHTLMPVEDAISQTQEFADELKEMVDYARVNLSKHVDFAAMVNDLPPPSSADMEYYGSMGPERGQTVLGLVQFQDVMEKLTMEFEEIEKAGLDYPPYYNEVMDILETFAHRYDNALESCCAKFGSTPDEVLPGHIPLRQLQQGQEALQEQANRK